MFRVLWWIRYVILILLGIFFFIFVVDLLIAAYQLKDPAWFIMTFFASNLIILISAALVVGFIFRMIAVYKALKDVKE